MVTARRQELAASRADNLAQQLAAVKAYEPRLAEAAARIERTRQAWQDANEAAGRQHAEHRGVLMALEGQCRRIDIELHEMASPAIAAFCAEMLAEARAVYDLQDSVSLRTVDGGDTQVWTNYPSVRRRSEACMATARASEALVFEALDDEALDRRFAELREALPAIDERPEKYRGPIRDGVQYA
jgi:hypothetical protein